MYDPNLFFIRQFLNFPKGILIKKLFKNKISKSYLTDSNLNIFHFNLLN